MLNPDNIHQKLVELGDAWADAHGAAEMLEEAKKPLIAKLMMQSEQKSMSGKEMEAYQSEEYKEHYKAMVEAKTKANKAKVRYNSAQVWSELKRTEAANLRATLGSAT